MMHVLHVCYVVRDIRLVWFGQFRSHQGQWASLSSSCVGWYDARFMFNCAACVWLAVFIEGFCVIGLVIGFVVLV